MENLKEKLIDIDCSDCGACCFCLNSIGGKDESGKIIIGLDGWCVHRIDGGCDIYEDRPEACINFEKGGLPCLVKRKEFFMEKRNRIKVKTK